jgi:hypothetical protein
MSSTDALMPRRYAARVAITGIANGVASALCAALAIPLLVAALGLANYGQWAVLGAFVTAGAALDLGMSRAIVVQCVGQSRARVRECATAAAMVALGVCALALTSLAMVDIFGVAHAMLTPDVMIGGGLVLAIGTMNGVLRAVLESQLAVHWVNVGYLLQTLLFYGLTIAAAFWWPRAVLTASVCAFACTFVFHAALLWRQGLLWPLRPDWATFRELFVTARASYVLAAPTALLPPLAAGLALAHAPDSAAYAVFDLGYRIAILASTLLASIAVPMLAIAGRAHRLGGAELPLARLTNRYLLAGWTLFACGMLVYALIGARLLAWIFPAAGRELFVIGGGMLAGLGAVAASEAPIRAMLGGTRTQSVLLARVVLLAIVGGVGYFALRTAGLAGFAATFMVAGFICAAIVLVAWWQRQRPRRVIT